jgi:hypothetical protein
MSLAFRLGIIFERGAIMQDRVIVHELNVARVGVPSSGLASGRLPIRLTVRVHSSEVNSVARHLQSVSPTQCTASDRSPKLTPERN